MLSGYIYSHWKSFVNVLQNLLITYNICFFIILLIISIILILVLLYKINKGIEISQSKALKGVFLKATTANVVAFIVSSTIFHISMIDYESSVIYLNGLLESYNATITVRLINDNPFAIPRLRSASP